MEQRALAKQMHDVCYWYACCRAAMTLIALSAIRPETSLTVSGLFFTIATGNSFLYQSQVKVVDIECYRMGCIRHETKPVEAAKFFGAAGDAFQVMRRFFRNGDFQVVGACGCAAQDALNIELYPCAWR